MEEVGSQNPKHAARHEAGHAVVGLLKGFDPKAIRLWEQNARWVGDCDFGEVNVKTMFTFSFGASEDSMDATDAVNHIAKSIAGALAQCRTAAEEAVGGCAKFITDANLDSLIHILLEEIRSGPSVNAGTCELQFATNKGVIPHTMEGAWVSGADIGGLRQAAAETMYNAKTVTEETVRDVMQLLNVESNWKAVIALANDLLSQPVDSESRKHVLKGEALAKAIGRLELPFNKRG